MGNPDECTRRSVWKRQSANGKYCGYAEETGRSVQPRVDEKGPFTLSSCRDHKKVETEH